MKRLFLVLAILAMAAPVCAEPWLVCDPQSDATGYIYTLNGGAPVTVLYSTITIGGVTYAKIADAANVPTGLFTYEVKAYRDDPAWGRLESATVPFSGTRPSLGAPLGLGLKR